MRTNHRLRSQMLWAVKIWKQVRASLNVWQELEQRILRWAPVSLISQAVLQIQCMVRPRSISRRWNSWAESVTVSMQPIVERSHRSIWSPVLWQLPRTGQSFRSLKKIFDQKSRTVVSSRLIYLSLWLSIWVWRTLKRSFKIEMLVQMINQKSVDERQTSKECKRSYET